MSKPRLTSDQALAVARQADERSSAAKRARLAKQDSQVEWQPWEKDRALLPKRPPGRSA